MGKLVDLSGHVFNRLTVVRKSKTISKTGALWECVCSCGNSTVVATLKLRNETTKSCGCWRTELRNNLTHGYSKTGNRTYRSWKELRQRCLNPNSDKWQWYGGRGITVCRRWDSFENFLADMGERPAGMSIDRLNSDGDYEPSNCRWATAKEQAETNRGCFKKNQIPWNKRSEGEGVIIPSLRSGAVMGFS